MAPALDNAMLRPQRAHAHEGRTKEDLEKRCVYFLAGKVAIRIIGATQRDAVEVWKGFVADLRPQNGTFAPQKAVLTRTVEGSALEFASSEPLARERSLRTFSLSTRNQPGGGSNPTHVPYGLGVVS